MLLLRCTILTCHSLAPKITTATSILSYLLDEKINMVFYKTKHADEYYKLTFNLYHLTELHYLQISPSANAKAIS